MKVTPAATDADMPLLSPLRLPDCEAPLIESALQRSKKAREIRCKQVVQYVAAALVTLACLPTLYYIFNSWPSHSSPPPQRSGVVSIPKVVVNDSRPVVLPIVPPGLAQPYYVYPEARWNMSVAVTIVVVVSVGTPKELFTTARNTIECYAALHNYSLSVEFDDMFPECAKHKDNYFRRHCHAHKIMKTQMADGEVMLYLDGDVGVVNPRRHIEEFVEDGYDIYLYDRFYNWEYAMCTYMVRNTERGRDWVDQFANYEFKLPNSFHGTDNGALHPLMMHYLVPETKDPKTRTRVAELCLDLWNRSKNYDDLFGMQACTRMVIGERIHYPEYKVKLIPKAEGWGRDLWTLHSHWATDDFMFHSLKENALKPFPADAAGQKRCHDALANYEYNDICKFAFPVLKKLDIDKCREGTEGWLMEGRLQIDNETRRKILDTMATRILKQQMEHVGVTAGKIENVAGMPIYFG